MSSIHNSRFVLAVTFVCFISLALPALAADTPQALVKRLKVAYDKGDTEAFAACYHPGNVNGSRLAVIEAGRAIGLQRVYKAVAAIEKRFGKDVVIKTLQKERPNYVAFLKKRNRFSSPWIVLQMPATFTYALEGNKGKAKGVYKVATQNMRATYAGDFKIIEVSEKWYADKSSTVSFLKRFGKQRAEKWLKDGESGNAESMAMIVAFEKIADELKDRDQLESALIKAVNAEVAKNE